MTHTSPATTADNTDRHPARKPLSLFGIRPASEIASYGDVPWYRKQEFALFPLFVPAMIVIALTGGIYCNAGQKPMNDKMHGYSDAAVWRYTAAARAFFVAVGVILIATVLTLVV